VSEPARWLEAVRQVVTAVRASDVTHLELSSGDFSVRVRRAPAIGETQGQAAAKDDDDGRYQRVAAPFTGVFYRSPTPSARAYVNDGDWVTAETVIGLVETMKIFNEVTADVSGRVVGFRAENGQLVHVGDVLVLIEPGERTTAESEPRV
jgi:acetyl-CoA carboxylase biotin carboxyl carrier protein